ncbi:MAG: group III truncated hemoglobin [Pseudomonadota bacterium]
MANPDSCTEAQITEMVHRFYARVRHDAVLGPIFNAHVEDWDTHLSTLVDFWSSTLRGIGRYRGSPMLKHVALPEVTAELFDRWLALFNETTAAQSNQEMARRAQMLAGRIAQSLWYGCQLSRQPKVMATRLGSE